MAPKTPRVRLSAAQIQEALAGLPGWTLTATGRLRRELRFPDFPAAFAFLTAVAFRAEAAQHHPDFGCSWRNVWLELWTHDAGGLTGLDLDLARAIDRLAPAGG
jgi:4a-hydroxytetrahydrobiopterin dehydratase